MTGTRRPRTRAPNASLVDSADDIDDTLTQKEAPITPKRRHKENTTILGLGLPPGKPRKRRAVIVEKAGQRPEDRAA